MLCELLSVPPLPAFSGFASRLLAETWDSSNLYWADWWMKWVIHRLL